MNEQIRSIRRDALSVLVPPPRLNLSNWIESNVYLPEGVSATPGPMRLWPFQREIADAIGDPTIERVTLVKPVRVGFTSLLTGALASFAANDPAPILALLPTEADARDYAVSDVEPIFEASPALSGLLSSGRDGSRNTLLSRRFPGGSLKLVAAKSPRNLRRHNVRVLLIDEADAMEPGSEGSPLRLAERRTLSFADRKIVIGSTPIFEETSNVLRSYAASDMRVFEVPCPDCGALSEILWQHIEWQDGQPETAAFRCPHCEALVDERHKPAMVEAGAWCATRPDVPGHAGFKINALVSLLHNASWAKLAAEFLAAREDPAELQTFRNTILAEGWRLQGKELNDDELAARAEPFGLDNLPAEVLAMTAGVDVQHNRLECTFVGWDRDGGALVLGHTIVWGSWDDDGTWDELDEVLRTRWAHPLGGQLGLDATVVDAGDGTTMERVVAFCAPRGRRKTLASKGMAGNRAWIEPSRSKKGRGRIWIVGVDGIKTALFERLGRAGAVRFSAELPLSWFEQLASERLTIRYNRGQPTRRFERVSGRAAEALDCTVYAMAARRIVNVNFDARAGQLRSGSDGSGATSPKTVRSAWLAGQT